jgi:hypothetical protein
MPIYKEVHLETDYEFILSQDYDKHYGSCIAHQVHELQDIHDRFGGMPATYNDNNTQISQLWFEDGQLDFADISKQLGIDIVTVSAIRLKPGNTIPLHRDTFYKIKTQFPDDERPRVRANINLEKWKTGHIIQYDDKVITGWKQGDGHLWDSAIEHLGANCGMESKYSLQVSGFLIN